MNIIKRKNLVINSNISTVFNKFIDDNSLSKYELL